MSVKLRLRREGTRKKPHYRIVAADTRSPRDGRFIEIIGDYHPMDEPSSVNVVSERALYWLRNGAQPSAQVENLLRITGVWAEFRPEDTTKPEPTTRQRVSKKQRAKAEEQQASSGATGDGGEAGA